MKRMIGGLGATEPQDGQQSAFLDLSGGIAAPAPYNREGYQVATPRHTNGTGIGPSISMRQEIAKREKEIQEELLKKKEEAREEERRREEERAEEEAREKIEAEER
jgi:hypothetical protein